MGLDSETSSMLVNLALLYSYIAVLIKRCHDRNRSGLFLLLSLIPLLNFWPWIELWFLKGTPGRNQYGEEPDTVPQQGAPSPGSVDAVLARINQHETIINKADTDFIFTINKQQWEEYAKRMVVPEGWDIRLSPHDPGTAVGGYNERTGVGMSVQPFYQNDTSPPDILIVGNYFPIGTLPRFTDELKQSMEAAAKKDLGVEYDVSLIYKQLNHSMDWLQLLISKVKDRNFCPNCESALRQNANFCAQCGRSLIRHTSDHLITTQNVGDSTMKETRTQDLSAQVTPTVQCWHCKTPITVTPEVRGQEIRCPACHTKQELPL
jgi:hypothetical protein